MILQYVKHKKLIMFNVHVGTYTNQLVCFGYSFQLRRCN